MSALVFPVVYQSSSTKPPVSFMTEIFSTKACSTIFLPGFKPQTYDVRSNNAGPTGPQTLPTDPNFTPD